MRYQSVTAFRHSEQTFSNSSQRSSPWWKQWLGQSLRTLKPASLCPSSTTGGMTFSWIWPIWRMTSRKGNALLHPGHHYLPQWVTLGWSMEHGALSTATRIVSAVPFTCCRQHTGISGIVRIDGGITAYGNYFNDVMSKSLSSACRALCSAKVQHRSVRILCTTEGKLFNKGLREATVHSLMQH